MKSFRYLAVIAALPISFLAGALFQKYGVPAISRTAYLRLQEPLLVNAEGELKDYHILPAGTALYKDYSFPEGHSRYIVYLNIKGSFAAEKIESDKPNLVDPIWGHTIQRDDLATLVAQTPVSKDDLVRILKARKMTREELAQIVREWRD